MLAARGVSLGLGKINLSELNQLPAPNRVLINRVERQKRREKELERLRHKLIVRKHVDKQTLWTACSAVIVGAIVIVLGFAMTIIGYFDRDLATTAVRNATLGTTVYSVNDALRYKLKCMQYVGPISMGVGTFLLIIACVITLESRDRHTQIIQDQSAQYNPLWQPAKNSSGQVSTMSEAPAETKNDVPGKTSAEGSAFFHTVRDADAQHRRLAAGAAPLVDADSVLELSGPSSPMRSPLV